VEEAVDAGINTMAIITGRGKRAIEDHFDISYELEHQIKGGGEIQITDALLEQAKKGQVIAYKFKGKRFDCGSIDGFVTATNYFYENEV
jgi:UTP--glucose-1-phosphate uridylyltransferase